MVAEIVCRGRASRCGPGDKILSPSALEIAGFQERIAEFYRANGRTFPWRENITPYRIVVSEIMLQQTGVERVINKFGPFIDRFPDFNTLAVARLSGVMDAWQGLGYNRRALSLKKLAGIVVDTYSGVLPSDRGLLKALPGIGDATAGAVLAFAFDLPSVFIETNVRRVFIHHFFAGWDKVADADILPFVEATLDRSCPRDWYSALMDYGTYLSATHVNPNRKSARHVRQSRFQDSDRQVRGMVIRILLDESRASLGDIAGRTGCTPVRLVRILNSLAKDGIVVCDADIYRIT